ncbi:fasciclin domain-containing protein, partial [Streptomyces sp. NPDC048491]
MNALRIRRATLAVTAAAVLPLVLSACGGSDSKKDSSSSSSEAAAPPAAQSSAGGDTAMTDKPFGTACASVPKDGAGSFDGMAKDPVATAASHNPALSTLVAAVKKAGLVDTLNNAQNITVFAPTNDAFAKIPKADLDKVLND